jgi:hypothetical protein
LGANGAFKKFTGWGGILGPPPASQARPSRVSFAMPGVARALWAGLTSGFRHLKQWFWYVMIFDTPMKDIVRLGFIDSILKRYKVAKIPVYKRKRVPFIAIFARSSKCATLSKGLRNT